MSEPITAAAIEAVLRERLAPTQLDSVLGFHYDDTTFGSIGAEYKYSDTVTLRGGVAYDESPTSYGHRGRKRPP